MREDQLKKDQYYQKFSDCFVLKQKNEVIGIGVNNLSDWQSYYMRYFILLPQYRGQGIFQAYTEWLIGVLSRHGVNRIEMHVSPSNPVQIHRVNKLGFAMTGLSLSERWGAMIHFTRFLQTNLETHFVESFCSGD